MSELGGDLQASIVFVDAENGDDQDSIEIVPDSRENTAQPDVVADDLPQEDRNNRDDITLVSV